MRKGRQGRRRVDTVVLDKTGTVTTGRMSLVGVVAHGAEEAEVRRVAAALEHGSEHPIARAVATAAPREEHPEVSGFANREGLGVVGDVSGRRTAVGRPALLEAEGLALPAPLADALEAAQAQGRTPVLVGWDGAAVARTSKANAPRHINI